MTSFRVILDVDGDEETEIVNAPDAKLAMSKALKAHPTKVLAVTPLDIQTSLDDVKPEDHPGQTDIDDAGHPVDAGMARVAGELADGAARASVMDREPGDLPNPQAFKEPGARAYAGPSPQPIDEEERARAEAPVVGPFEAPESVSLDDLGPDGEVAA